MPKHEVHIMPKLLPNGPMQWEPSDFILPFKVNALSTMQAPLAAVAEFNAKLCESAAQFGAEWLAFLSRRLKEDWAVPQRMASCASPQELQQVYVDYLWKTLSQYQEEFGRLARLGKLVAREAASALEKEAGTIGNEGRRAA